jgi:hypothetical protein
MNFDEIIKNFIEFKTINFIKNVQHMPDTSLTLLDIDGKKYILDETDYFNSYYDSMWIKEAFGLEVKEWIKAKNNSSNELTSKSAGPDSYMHYALALIG